MNHNRTKAADKIAMRTFIKYHGKRPNQLSNKEREMFCWNKSDGVGNAFGAYRKTRCFCSDPFCCGNPRKIGEQTKQERIADIRQREQIEEYRVNHGS
jgi:hypothetical protein